MRSQTALRAPDTGEHFTTTYCVSQHPILFNFPNKFQNIVFLIRAIVDINTTYSQNEALLARNRRNYM